METPDRPSVERPDNPESERLIDAFGIDSQLWRIHRSLGIQIERPDEDATEEELKDWRERMLDITLCTTFNEFSIGNEILWRRKAMQHESTIQEILGTNIDPSQLSQEDLATLDQERRELVVANNGMTYNEYLPAVVQQTVAFMDLYLQEFQQVLPSLPTEQREHLQEQYRQSVEYLYFLKRAIDERRNVSNIYNLNNQIAEVQSELMQEDLNSDAREELEGRGAVYHTARNQIFTMLSPASKRHIDEIENLYQEWQRTQNPELLQEYEDMRGNYMDELDSDLLEILKGNPEGREDLGVEQNFLPQRIYLQIIQLRYNQLRDIQIQISTIEDWTDQDRDAAQEELNTLRRSYMDAIVMVTQQLAGHHVVMAELTTIQNQFGNDFNLTDAGNSPGIRASQRVAERIEDSIDGAKDFHLERLQAMLTQVDRSFNPNGQDELIDFGVMTAVEIVDWLSQGVRDLITVAIPEGETRDSIDGWIDEVMPLAIQESLESGVGPDGEPITKEEKLEKIRDVIIRFRETNAVDQYQTTVTLLQGMPDASRFVGEQLVDPLPEEEIRTAADRDRLRAEYNGATVYTMLIRQMKNDCEVFDEAYANFLGDMEDLVDIRLGLVAELNTIKEGWKRFAWTMLGAAGGAAVSSWIAAAVGGGLALNI
ncbi:hypothetical protein HOC67_01790, partial [Candidatus Peregrinibacteria bacterium]|nr:hypothetical protein [Candidatus Peregrinibacteria bacterium]